jgi:hypothetical protein
MAKKQVEKVDEAAAYPSRFGSHQSMVDEKATEAGVGTLLRIESGKVTKTKYTLKEDEVFLQDENGLYATKKNRIDSGMSDPNRYCPTRLHKQLQLNAGESSGD